MNSKTIFYIALFSITILSFKLTAQNNNDNWPNWRGPNENGASLNGTPPTEWSETKNVKWKTPIPGKGLGTPVVWGDQIFITTSIELDQQATKEAIKRVKEKTPAFMKVLGMSQTTKNFLQFVVYSINRKTGKINWKKVVREQFPHEGVQSTASWASASCVTDGEHIIASFGSYGIYCFDMKGNLIWEKDLGDMEVLATWGEGTSPVLYKDNLIIVWDHQGQSKIFVLNKKTGDEIWQKNRDEITTWATPLVAELENKIQIVVSGNRMSMGYDITNGDEIWELGGLQSEIISSPVFDGELAFLMSGAIGAEKIVQAIDLKTAKGNLENSKAIKWTYDKNTSYVPTALLSDGKLYYLKGNRSQLSCIDGKTGNFFYETQNIVGMRGGYASPVSANGNIYVIDRKGTCSVIKEGEKFELIAQNKLDDNFDASPAIVGNELILRGFNSLYCIAE